MFHAASLSTPTPGWLTDPHAFAVNRVPSRSSHRTDAATQSLDGTWDIALTSRDRVSLLSPTDAFDQGEVHRLPVPSTLEAEGL